MEVVYNISFNVSISNIEAGLLYKYLEMHPVEKQYIGEGHFACSFKDFDEDKEFEIMINSEIIDSCLTVLEDQDLNDPSENEIKQRLINKIYNWFDIIYDEEKAIDELKNEYYLNSGEQFCKNNGDFSFENYLKLQDFNCSDQNVKKQNLSVSEKIKLFFKL